MNSLLGTYKSNDSFNFDSKFTFEQRKEEANRILSKYPDRIPVIVEPTKSCKIELDKNKYLVPSDLTMGQFLYVIKKRIKLSSERALFLFVNGTVPSSTSYINAIYENNKDTDGFLKIMFSEENVFG